MWLSLTFSKLVRNMVGGGVGERANQLNLLRTVAMPEHQRTGVRKYNVAWFIVVKNLETSSACVSVAYALSRTSKCPILEVLGAEKSEVPWWEDEKGNLRLLSFVRLLFVSSEVCG